MIIENIYDIPYIPFTQIVRTNSSDIAWRTYTQTHLWILLLYYQSNRVGEQSIDQKYKSTVVAIVVSSFYASTASWASIRARQPFLLPKKVLRVSLEDKKENAA